MKVTLKQIANVIRSKNAGPYELTLDVMLKDASVYQTLKANQAINPQVDRKSVV